ncbi:thioredoxin-like protein AAED1, chloroplastic isoform X2 [Apium graveolens]|uniref:thioredoxin-like protein AAED1, chloroplastic isoform X2 n=1 Tax=Apium graveolens TaxID=4045 RepID=UPI003D7BCF40
MASLTLVPPNTFSLNKHTHHNKKSSSANYSYILPKRTLPCFSSNNNHLFNVSPRITRTLVSSSVGRGVESSSVVSEDTTSLLQRVEVFDLNGNSVLISDLWKDRKAVVAFARHFGCVLCRKRAAYLADKKDVMDASGVTLVIIGPGSVDQAKTFAEQTGFKGDPAYSSYKALSFVSGVTTTFTPGAGLKIIQLYMEGYRQDWGISFEKDTRERGGWQQGGILVAGPGISNISYLHKDKEAGDDPDIKDILKACCS